ncbi:MAG: ATP-binding cassette domain-containing protein [Solirubrobacterales bacterium]
MDNLLSFHDLYRTIGSRNSFIKESGAVSAGRILSVKGPSGVGKSTLLRMLARLIEPDSGEMYFKGQPWRSIPAENWRRSIQYLSQKPVMFSGSVAQNFVMPFNTKIGKTSGDYPKVKAEAYMKALDLPLELLDQNAQKLSGGEASRVALIRALLIDPEVLLLDEPTAYLDGDSRQRVLHLIGHWVKQPERAVIMVSHNGQDAADLEDVTILEMTCRPGGGGQ